MAFRLPNPGLLVVYFRDALKVQYVCGASQVIFVGFPLYFKHASNKQVRTKLHRLPNHEILRAIWGADSQLRE
jgi:hypothetical protein